MATQTPPQPLDDPRFMRDKLAQYLVGGRILDRIVRNAPNEQNGFGPGWLPIRNDYDPFNLPPVPETLRTRYSGGVSDAQINSPDKPAHIGIIGAGITGLFLAFLIDRVNEMRSPNNPLFTYTILESSGRTGGRVLTKHFDEEIWNDYYDIGAMRYPDIPIMARTFHLFETLGFSKPKETEGNGDKYDDGKDTLMKYHFKGENCPSRFNDITHVSTKDDVEDPFNFSISKEGNVPDSTVKEGADVILENIFGPYKQELKKDFVRGFEKLMKKDHFTTRDYLREIEDMDFYSIQYLETTNSASGLFDQAFTESVIDSFDFDYPADKDPKTDDNSVKWYCVKGGTSKIINKLENTLHTKPILKHRVTAIRYKKASRNETFTDRHMELDITHDHDQNHAAEKQTLSFSTVFNTASLACTRRMDLRTAGCSRTQLDAMRSVHYDASTKVAIEFTRPWWIQDCNIRGGSASSDLPIRTCVYPSYNLDATGKAVLLCSYTWAQDAQRMGSLVDNVPAEGGARFDGSRNPTQKDGLLKELLVHNLALLHQSPGLGYEEMYAIIEGAYRGHDAFDWYGNPHSAGAFALFGPGQFRAYFPFLVEPAAEGHLFLAGEACSAHHAWIVGSLDSALRALTQYLLTLRPWVDDVEDILGALEREWGVVREVARDEMDWQAVLSKVDMGKGGS
ncbi:hypothetical protein N7466_003200 [Penicillium verhagenii]|uniref:uncharacterized protein n=1 Tax=Penicillium verhagenii TaxID=1562060 RepID=UPI0025459B81|nr:uncharacterized protein N7466_003200 [Penicillium verhagenii]KAJ5936750.1 hypothetical protein N7466_003200 [Penicillium verhagenii]